MYGIFKNMDSEYSDCTDSSEDNSDDYFEIVKLTAEDFKSGLTVSQIVEKHQNDGTVEKVAGSFNKITLTDEDLKAETTVSQICEKYN